MKRLEFVVHRETLSSYGHSQREMMRNILSGNREQQKAGRTLLTKQFPKWRYTAADKWQISMKKNAMGPDQRIAFEKDEEEADKIASLRFHKTTATYVEHFRAMLKTKDGTDGKVLQFVNPVWVDHHFHEKFVAIVRASAADSAGWITVPIGSSCGGKDPKPPKNCIVQGVRCCFLQEEYNTCLFFSFASALFSLLD
jgi:hypothetical protein